MEFDHVDQYRIIFWKGNIDDDKMMLKYCTAAFEYETFKYHSAIVMNRDKTVLFACTNDNDYSVSKYVLSKDTKKWEKKEDLKRSETDDVEVMLQLKLDKNENMLFGKSNNATVVINTQIKY